MSATVSIIMPYYNAANYVAEAIESVIAQDYSDWELIVIDDASDDEGESILQKYAISDPRIKLLHNEKNYGPAFSRNVGIKVASGEYIAFLDSDDIWLKNKLSCQISFLQRNGLLCAYSAYDIIDKDGESVKRFGVPPKVTYDDMLKKSYIGMLTLIYNAKTLGKKYFVECGHEDYLYKLELVRCLGGIYGIDKALAKYRRHASGVSANKFVAAVWRWRIYREFERIGFVKSLYVFFCYVINALRS